MFFCLKCLKLLPNSWERLESYLKALQETIYPEMHMSSYKILKTFLHAYFVIYSIPMRVLFCFSATPTLHCKYFPRLDLTAGGWDTLESMLRELFILETFPSLIVQPKQHNLEVLSAGYPSLGIFFPHFILLPVS